MRVVSDVNAVRMASDVVTVISNHVTLQRSGRTWKGLCPFHREKTPSFTVMPDQQRWRCYGCGLYGDVFAFVMQAEQLTFPEAVRLLAERAGLDYRPQGSSQDRGAADRRQALLEANRVAHAWFQAQLQQSQDARSLFTQRGLTAEMITAFGLGYAPDDWRGLLRRLEERGIDRSVALEAGLLSTSDSGAVYDRFRHRLMFPIWDKQGKVIGFGARAIGDATPKYLNTSETPLFVKSRVVYALHLARQAISDSGRVILCEGYMDVIAAHQAGLRETVATMGTAITRDHVQELQRYASVVYVCYDGDSAGLKAAHKAGQELQEHGVEPRIVKLPDAHDPDSLLRAQGVDALRAAIESAVPYTQFLIDQVLARYDLSVPAGRIAALKEATPLLASIPSQLDREAYIVQLAPLHPAYTTNPSTPEIQIRREIERRVRAQRYGASAPPPLRPEGAGPIAPADVDEGLTRAAIVAESTLLRALCMEEWRTEAIPVVNPELMQSPGAQQFCAILLRVIAAQMPIDVASLLASMQDATASEQASRRLSAEEPLSSDAIRDSARWLANQAKRRQALRLSREIREDAEFLEYQRLVAELHRPPSPAAGSG